MTDSNGAVGRFEVWPLGLILRDVAVGSRDWTWDEEFADLDTIHPEELRALHQDIATNGIKEPVLIGNDGRLWDGHHRLRIAVRLGIGYVPVQIIPPESLSAQVADYAESLHTAPHKIDACGVRERLLAMLTPMGTPVTLAQARQLGRSAAGPNETGASVGESLEAVPADIDAGTDADLLCTPCANNRHNRCWERRGIARCGGKCFTADDGLRRALTTREVLKGTLVQRDALITAVQGCVDTGGPSLVADLKALLAGAYLMPEDYEYLALTHQETWEEMERLGTEAYQAQDALEFVREMCALRSQSTPLVTIEQVLVWSNGSRCMHVTVDPGEGS